MFSKVSNNLKYTLNLLNNMETESVYFWSFCLLSLFAGKVVSNYLFPEPAKFLEAYGGCDCREDDTKKFETVDYRGKRYRRATIQESTMTYRYCKIYNVSKSEWAHDVSGGDDARVVWETNEWDENDALVGFYSDDDGDFHNVIFSRPGYAIYVQSDSDRDKENYKFEGCEYRIPPAMLVNLNDAYDTEFVHAKNYPNDDDSDSDDSDSQCDESDNDDIDEDNIHTRKYPKLYARCTENDALIPLLQKCRENTNNTYKKKAYTRAIIELISINYKLTVNSVDDLEVGESIKRKITDYLMGIPEDDIINS
jgi:hypothetical protein